MGIVCRKHCRHSGAYCDERRGGLAEGSVVSATEPSLCATLGRRPWGGIRPTAAYFTASLLLMVAGAALHASGTLTPQVISTDLYWLERRLAFHLCYRAVSAENTVRFHDLSVD
ncbi:hypothetical protein [Sodalis sp.]|uniref:hypothetical protein n=1 Tax=Sodalis sp. (in: enterobacteria) TaxID=1898979 RepID=UPI003872D4D8